MCTCGEYCDRIAFTVIFNDRPNLQAEISGETGCDSWYHTFARQITPSNLAAYAKCDSFVTPAEDCDQVSFVQEVTYHRYVDVVARIVQNVTVQGLARFDKHDYDCQIEGDGTQQHYGPVGTVPASQIRLLCRRVSGGSPSRDLETPLNLHVQS